MEDELNFSKIRGSGLKIMFFSPTIFLPKVEKLTNKCLAKSNLKKREQRKIVVYFWISCFSTLSARAAQRT